MKVDTTAIEQESAAYEKQLRQHYSTKSRLMEEIDSLDPDDRHFIARKSDLDDRLYKMYDKIQEVENGLMDARAKRQPNGQWLKSVRFKLPIIDHDLELSLDNQDRVEVVCSMVRFKKH